MPACDVGVTRLVPPLKTCSNKSMSNNLDPAIAQAFELDKHYLETTKIPIVTVSGTTREDLKELYKLPFDDTTPDVVFSRAHYTMALAIASQVWGDRVDRSKAWMVDPTNYVTRDQWSKIQLTEFIGKTLARQPLLKRLKDFIDQFGRSKLPILKSITPALEYLTQDIKQPILSMHIASGNILAEAGKKVVQVITDPHVRYDYLTNAERPNMSFCVFDEKTKVEFLEKAALAGKKVDPAKVVVTGPPVDPRIIAKREHKKIWTHGPLKLCLTTGGLGTNKQEIKLILQALMPELRKHERQFELLVYAGTQSDIAEMVREVAHEAHVAVGKLEETSAELRVIYHPQIVDANELLMKYGFPWAHGFISKPSGDMAYDAVGAGCFLLTLEEWGEWEHNIRQLFEERMISRAAEGEKIVTQLQAIMSPHDKDGAWITQAMTAAQEIDPLFLNGAANIAKAV